MAAAFEHTKYSISIDDSVSPTEVLLAREEVPNKELLETWRLCLAQSMCVVSAREKSSGKLVGIGFLVGNRRHGEIVDLSVHSSVRQSGLGGQIVDALMQRARQLEITYFGLTYDKTKPWLKDFYSRHGFRSIDFAMWSAESLGALPD